MQPPPPPPGPYDHPPFPPPGQHLRPAPRPRARGRRVPLIIVAAVVLAAVGVAVGITLSGGSKPRGRFTHELTACSLLTVQQIHAYVPGAAAGKSETDDFCEWDAELDPKQVANHVIVFVEGVAHDTGGVPTAADGHEKFDIRRQQADEPGTRITPASIGDEAFVACVMRQPGNHADCRTYVRVSNAVFCVQVQSTTGDPAPASRALAAEAVRHLPPH
ncbi:hypothetical protein Airi01_091670 [Actinoallomurus iriomotensis]|uniref:DUF3558 domain-containing protein n=1 Tax=Actinoallomurus iriomotensis TaxID=478107 RepID=A0A9W6VUL7_9ACTN|nr:hypothetical protein Airi01_091670 [Actinoallomurus iriomotensis]